MHNRLVSYRELLQSTLDQGTTLGRAMEFLRSSGASPLEAAIAVQEATGRSWDEARQVVTESRAWAAPRSAVQPVGRPREGYGAMGQHGRSGHGAMSVLPHLWRPAPRATSRASR